VVDHHLISADTEEILGVVPVLAPHRDAIDGRATLCRKTKVFPVECVVRGYLSGSAWRNTARSAPSPANHCPRIFSNPRR
jgi:phosphoribosylaminoimidazole-succinocarboxamide synthase